LFLANRESEGKARKEHREGSMNRRRCEHTTYPVEVLPLDGGKKIAYCLVHNQATSCGMDRCS
jgi:hypothetical protein